MVPYEFELKVQISHVRGFPSAGEPRHSKHGNLRHKRLKGNLLEWAAQPGNILHRGFGPTCVALSVPGHSVPIAQDIYIYINKPLVDE